MKITTNSTGGRTITGDTPWGRFTFDLTPGADGAALFVLNGDGVEVGKGSIVFTQPMPLGFDVETEKRRASQGGCCGAPAGE